jgi:Holliday junction resolvase RusA-like endonuclease
MIKLSVPPAPKPRMTQSDKWHPTDAAERYWTFKDNLNLAAREAGFELGEAFRVVFLMPVPASWSKRKRAAIHGRRHTQRPDTDNLVKAVKDALLARDEQVWCEYATKIWVDGPGAILIENMPDDEQEKILAEINKELDCYV